jgi:osmoprotectant transport system substrate-binding protein
MPTRRQLLALPFAIPLALGPMSRLAAAVPVVVGSKLDLEGELLGELIALALSQAGIATQTRLQLGPTMIVRGALLSGAIDLYPECAQQPRLARSRPRRQ